MKRFFLIMATALVLGGVLGMFFFWRDETADQKETDVPSIEETPVIEKKVVEIPVSVPVVVEKLPDTVSIAGVPFTVQAPYGEWSDPIFQDACEEASVVMASAWVNGTGLTKELAKKDIEALAALQKKKFGHSVDTSVEDTAWLFQEFFAEGSATVEKEVTIERMKAVLAEGNIVIVPTDGRALKNPNFTQPGPPRHMLVVTGYDDTTKEFIVNDPGTRKGEGYRYAQTVLFDAILDYPTGKHAPVTSTDKAMIVVGKN